MALAHARLPGSHQLSCSGTSAQPAPALTELFPGPSAQISPVNRTNVSPKELQQGVFSVDGTEAGKRQVGSVQRWGRGLVHCVVGPLASPGTSTAFP